MFRVHNVSRGLSPTSFDPLRAVLGVVAGMLSGVIATQSFAAEKVWVELESPTNEVTLQSPVGLIEVKGWTGTGLRGGHDVLIAIDRSASVWDASGTDVDGDGRVGRNRTNIDLFLEYSRKCTDGGDTILRAELAAARKLIERLNPETTRMGLMSFGGGARVHAPIGSSRQELLFALAGIPDEPDFGGTSFDNALKLARYQFEAQPLPDDPSDRRNLSVILLSDGAPTAPAPLEHAKAFAILSAKDAAKLGVRVYAFALGPEAVRNHEIYEEITEVTGGELMLIDRPGDVTDFVPHLSLTKIARIEIDNLSSSEKARAVRVFPDGSFDGYAPLNEGLNILRITVYGEDGYERVVDRRVRFERVDADTDQRRNRAEQIVRDLKVRTLETELAEAARRRVEESRNRRVVSIETE